MIGSISYIFTSLPHLLLSYNFYKCNYALKFFICMLPNSGLATGIFSILFKERDDVGLTFGNLFARGIDYQFSVAEIMAAMLVGMLVLIMLVNYIEKAFPGDIGIPEKWYYPIDPIVRLMSERSVKETWYESEMKHFNDENFESEPIGNKIGICIENLSKSFGIKSVVSKVSLKLFEDQITVLLGQNGAGKTTTISMLTGMLPPTSGSISIDGNDISKDNEKAQTSIGICTQNNVMFNELTVVEHFVFFCKLKGLTDSKEIDQEVIKYVNLLGLSSDADKPSYTLSGGMKRKLSIGIALCGKSKIVICDEPTSEMDPAARRELWKLLSQEKKGRTILLTTHFMDEAEILGDRIAIMSKGSIKNVGSSSFLKNRFRSAYRLVCVKAPYCRTQNIHNLLNGFVHDVTTVSSSITEATFNIAESHLPLFERIFKALEDNSNKLGITSFSCSLTSLEEVYLNAASDSYKSINRQEIISTILKAPIDLSKNYN